MPTHVHKMHATLICTCHVRYSIEIKKAIDRCLFKHIPLLLTVNNDQCSAFWSQLCVVMLTKISTYGFDVMQRCDNAILPEQTFTSLLLKKCLKQGTD